VLSLFHASSLPLFGAFIVRMKKPRDDKNVLVNQIISLTRFLKGFQIIHKSRKR